MTTTTSCNWHWVKLFSVVVQHYRSNELLQLNYNRLPMSDHLFLKINPVLYLERFTILLSNTNLNTSFLSHKSLAWHDKTEIEYSISVKTSEYQHTERRHRWLMVRQLVTARGIIAQLSEIIYILAWPWFKLRDNIKTLNQRDLLDWLNCIFVTETNTLIINHQRIL